MVNSAAFEALVCNSDDAVRPSADVESVRAFIKKAVLGTKARDSRSLDILCAVLVRIAFIAPEAVDLVYDALTCSWLGLPFDAFPTRSDYPDAALRLCEKAELPEQFWKSFWSLVQDGGKRISPGEVTARVAALRADLPPSYSERAEKIAQSHPRMSGAATRGISDLLKLDTLTSLPPGSLGHDFSRFVIENNFDLEVLDREADGLRNLPPALRYLNLRVLQMHDIWHLAGGYTTSLLHENAISSFQLAQCGHDYSAMYLATAAMFTRVWFPDGRGVLLQVIAEAWQHSRKCPSFMEIEWEREWHLSVAELQRRHGIPPFDSIYAPDVIEQGFAIQDHPIIRGVQKLDRALGTRFERVLQQGLLALHVKVLAMQKKRRPQLAEQ